MSYGPPGPSLPENPNPPYGPPVAPQPYGPPGPAPFGAGPPVTPSKGKGLKIGLIVGGIVLLLALLCCGLGIYALVAYEPDYPTGPGALPPSTAPRSPGAEPTADATASVSFNKGDCVVNDGTADDAQLRKAPCESGTYEVLSVIPFTTDKSKCDDDPLFAAPETETTFVHDSPVDVADFVLCLKKL